MKNATDDLGDKLIIDQHRLDEALTRQPEYFWQVSNKLALLTSERDAAKQDFQIAEAEADAQLRRSAEIAGDKITEGEVKNLIRRDKAVVKAGRLLHDLNRELGVISALKESFQQRGYALKSLAELYIANYYADQSVGERDRHVRHARGETSRSQYLKERRERKEK